MVTTHWHLRQDPDPGLWPSPPFEQVAAARAALATLIGRYQSDPGFVVRGRARQGRYTVTCAALPGWSAQVWIERCELPVCLQT